MLEHNIHEQAKNSKGMPKKPMVQRTLKQSQDNIKTRSYSVRTAAEHNPTHEERIAIINARNARINARKALPNNQKTARTTCEEWPGVRGEAEIALI